MGHEIPNSTVLKVYTFQDTMTCTTYESDSLRTFADLAEPLRGDESTTAFKHP